MPPQAARATQAGAIQAKPKAVILAHGYSSEGRFMGGFAKKILIADVLAKTVNAAFELPVEAYTPLIGWLALIGFALQIYFDFSLNQIA